ncbi:M23 family metallopeptidase [Methylotenera versatilis]|uniref:M23 family metallopeptidase n=1 Tax=Methylotenera versatilis TaxID=1055487 RepID=UPI0006467580|nr:M23 family metallopeptidase [Methylotenera versatilis]
MNIILISNKLATAKSLSAFQAGVLITSLVLVPVMLTLLFITPPSNIKEQGMKALLPPQIKSSIISSQVHLDAYARELGELQARMMRLDAQSQRLAKLAGEKESAAINITSLKPVNNIHHGGVGGPFVESHAMTEADLIVAIEELTEAVNKRDDYLSSIEAKILQKSVLKDMLPNSSPIDAAFNSSSYGWRADPFNGREAFHEGLDFSANTGTDIRAAADGIVSSAERTPDYGNIVKINHGSGLETRYAHASKLLVKAGERVVKGQIVAQVGSTGRSTGPHLHYEIRLNGNALDPRKYLHQ